MPADDPGAVALKGGGLCGAGLWIRLQHEFIEQSCALHAHEQAWREHGIDEAVGVTEQDPAGTVSALAEELIVRVGHHIGDTACVRTVLAQQRFLPDDVFEALFGGAAESGGVIFGKNDADGQAVLQRDAPAPAVVQNGDDDGARCHLVMPEVLEVGEVGDVVARTAMRGQLQRAGKEARATGCVDEQRLGISGSETGRLSAFWIEDQRIAFSTNFGVSFDKTCAELFGTLAQEIVEFRTRRVVGVGWEVIGDVLKAEVQFLPGGGEEGGTGLVDAEFLHAVLDAELPKQRHDGGNERFADEQRRPLVIVENEHQHAA